MTPGLQWSEISEDVIELAPERVKTGARLRVPITSALREVLDGLPRVGRFVFRGVGPLHVSGTCAEILGDGLARAGCRAARVAGH